MIRRVLITGLGFITSIGNDQAAVVESLRHLRTGIAPYRFLNRDDLSIKVAGTIEEFDTESVNWRDWVIPDRFQIDRAALRSLSPHGLYAMCAANEAIADASLSAETLASGNTGLYCASAGSPRTLTHAINQMVEADGKRGDPMGILRSISGTLNFNLSAHYHIRGTNCGFVSACTSSSHALGYAFDDIALGRQECALVIGAEEMTAESILPFSAMRALSNNAHPESASRPFDSKRDGFVGSGGAVAVILESEESARARQAKAYGEFVAWGQAADGYAVASPHPEGEGLCRAIRRTLSAARISPAEIDYVNAHATSTLAGDRAEALALKSIFSPDWAHPAISSTKALTGHTLSMAGCLEFAVCALALQHQLIPGCANLDEPDPVCEGLNLPRETLDRPSKTVLNNNSGFGGVNVCHLLRSTD